MGQGSATAKMALLPGGAEEGQDAPRGEGTGLPETLTLPGLSKHCCPERLHRRSEGRGLAGQGRGTQPTTQPGQGAARAMLAS